MLYFLLLNLLLSTSWRYLLITFEKQVNVLGDYYLAIDYERLSLACVTLPMSEGLKRAATSRSLGQNTLL